MALVAINNPKLDFASTIISFVSQSFIQIGNVAAGSMFAAAQSLAAGGAASVVPIAVAAGAVAGTAVGVGYAGYKATQYYMSGNGERGDERQS